MGRKEFHRLRTSIDAKLSKECANCESSEDLHIHHIVPLSLGGSNRITNLARLCSECHSKAHGGNNLIEGATVSRRKNIAKGKRKGSVDPLGYKYVDGRYSINEEEAEIVRLIYRLRYQAEYSTLNIAKILNFLAIPCAGSAKQWTHPPIVRMLANEQYLGNSVYAGERMGEGVYPAIIDGELAESIGIFEAKYKGKRLPARNIDDFLVREERKQTKV